MVRALKISKPDYQLGRTDIVACSSTMRRLLCFVQGSDQAFRILVEAVGDTVFFLRRENSPFEVIPEVRGHGHTFPEAYTTWSPEVRGSESHQRILEYEFAGLKIVLRFEGDGYLKERVTEQEIEPHEPSSTPTDECNLGKPSPEDELLTSMGSAAISTINPADTIKSTEALKIEQRGLYIPQSAIFDLKTRSINKLEVDTLSEELPRLWISQIPNFMLAHHEFGIFKSIKVNDTRDKIKQWEMKNQENLIAFAALLKRLVAIARSLGKFEVVPDDEGKALELREQGGNVGDVLPSDLEEYWNNQS